MQTDDVLMCVKGLPVQVVCGCLAAAAQDIFCAKCAVRLQMSL